MSEHGGFDHWSPHSPHVVVAGKWFPHQRVDANRTVPNVNGLMTNRQEPQDANLPELPQNPELSQQMHSTKVNTGRRKYRKRVPTELKTKKELKRLPKINTNEDTKKKYKKIQYQSLKLNREAVAEITKLKLILNEKRQERTELENRFAELRLRLKKLKAGYSADEPRSSDSDTDTASEDGSVAQHDTEESSDMATETATVLEVHNGPRVPELTADCSTITIEESPLVSLADLARQIDGMFPQYNYDLDPIANMLTDEVSMCTPQPQQMANTFQENPLENLRQLEEPYGDDEVDMAIRLAMGSEEVKVNRIPPDPVATIFDGNNLVTTPANLDGQIQSMPTISEYNCELDYILEMELGWVSVPTCRQRRARQPKGDKTKLKNQYRKRGAKLSCPKLDRKIEQVSLQVERKAEIARRKLILEDRLREKEKLEIYYAKLCTRLQKLEMGVSIDEAKNYMTYLPHRIKSAPESGPVPVPATSSTTIQGNQYINNPADLSQKINTINSKHKYELEPVLQNIQFLHKLTMEHSLKKLIPTLRQIKSSKP